ncbi:hypothetical protein ACFL7D_05490 [candidate division KSB1 bacterium]
MYCTKCKCRFSEWLKECPNCNIPLVDVLSHEDKSGGKAITYDELISLVNKNYGRIECQLTAVDVRMQKQLLFPYRGHGYSWTEQLQGMYHDIPIDLKTTDTGKVRKWSFPYFGYGYAWAKRMEGSIGGNPAFIQSENVEMQKKQKFPYLGYGFAWTKSFKGQCGDKLKLELEITDVGRLEKYQFPYQGYGFAWEKQGTLIIRKSD